MGRRAEKSKKKGGRGWEVLKGEYECAAHIFWFSADSFCDCSSFSSHDIVRLDIISSASEQKSKPSHHSTQPLAGGSLESCRISGSCLKVTV